MFKEELPRLGYKDVDENVVKKEHIKRMHVHRLVDLFNSEDYEEFFKVTSFVVCEMRDLL